jgi:polyhydroxybutyrate depolymerase
VTRLGGSAALCAAMWSALCGATAPPGPAVRPGKDILRDLTVRGRPRVYHLHVPPGAGRRPLAAVINLHGLGSNASEQDSLSGMKELADKEGFFVLSPEGTGAGQSFNGGTCCGVALSQGIDDVGFVRAMLDDVSRDYRIDPKRIFATGMSNGGFMAHRLACELSDRIAAIAPVAGVLGVAVCKPTRSVSILQFHGTADALVQFGGGGLALFPPVEAVMQGWAERDGCKKERELVDRVQDVTCERYQGCPSGVDVELCRVDGGGHTWPGGPPVPRLGKTTTAISATERMWQFFKAHPR